MRLVNLSDRKGIASAPLLLGGILTSALASVCCIGPLLLLATGLSGAWMSRLMILEPYYPLLALLSLTLIAAGGWQLMQPKSCTKDRGEMISALPEFRTSAVFISALALTLILLSSEYWILWIAG